jgi:hypothetical protein
VRLPPGHVSTRGKLKMANGLAVGVEERSRQRPGVGAACQFCFDDYVAAIVWRDMDPGDIAQGHGFECDRLPESAGLHVPVLLSVGDFVVIQSLLEWRESGIFCRLGA